MIFNLNRLNDETFEMTSQPVSMPHIQTNSTSKDGYHMIHINKKMSPDSLIIVCVLNLSYKTFITFS